MSLDAFTAEVENAMADLDGDLTIDLDGQTRRELALLVAAYEPESVDAIVRRAIHLFAQDAIDRGSIDQQLRASYDLTYDEYLAGMTYEEMGGTTQPAADGDDRRYRF